MEDELMRDIIDCIDIPIVVRETVDVEDKYIIATAILTLIRKRENVAYQQGIINAHKHDMFSAKACMEANEQQLKEVQGEVE